jgi:hypothetical protein
LLGLNGFLLFHFIVPKKIREEKRKALTANSLMMVVGLLMWNETNKEREEKGSNFLFKLHCSLLFCVVDVIVCGGLKC